MQSILRSLLCLCSTPSFLSHTKRQLNVKTSIKSSILAATCIGAHARHHSLQGVRHSKPCEVVDEVKAQLKEKVQPAGNPLADVIVAAGKDKLSKKPEDKQTDLISKHKLLAVFDLLHDGGSYHRDMTRA